MHIAQYNSLHRSVVKCITQFYQIIKLIYMGKRIIILYIYDMCYTLTIFISNLHHYGNK